MATTIDPGRLAEAVAFAARAHAAQRRKGADAPYVCHPLQVCGLVLEHGGDEEQALAGLLHDTLEDAADVTRAGLVEAFGERVARIVSDLTDTLPGDRPEKKSPWRVRKERYLEHLRGVPDDSLLVAACDKRHNLGALLGDLRARGLAVMQSFNAGPLEQVWYYEQLLPCLERRVPERLFLELEDLVYLLRSQIQGGDTQRFRLGPDAAVVEDGPF